MEGRVRGKGTPLTVQERQEYYNRIDSEAFIVLLLGVDYNSFDPLWGIWLALIELYERKNTTNGNPSHIVILTK